MFKIFNTHKCRTSVVNIKQILTIPIQVVGDFFHLAIVLVGIKKKLVKVYRSPKHSCPFKVKNYHDIIESHLPRLKVKMDYCADNASKT